MSRSVPRLAVRAIVVHEARLLMVNAYPNGQSSLICAPGGGVECGSSLHDNLQREIYEETGLRVEVGAPCLVNEFHDPDTSFHQCDIYFRCTLVGTALIDPDWKDSDAVVDERLWLTRAELEARPHKPDSLARVAFEPCAEITYDPLERIVR